MKSDPETMTDEYFNLSEKYTLKYGSETVVLLQCGAFFEVYGYKCKETGLLLGSPISEFARICQMNIADKKAQYKGKSLFMAGFRDYCLDKYLQILVDNGYTAVVYVQKEDKKKFTRVFDSVHSPGTHIGSDDAQLSNHLMCIWLEQSKKRQFRYGVSVLNILNGQSSLMEHETKDSVMQSSTFDELEKYMSIYRPCEVLFISSVEESVVREKLLPMIGWSDRTAIHFYSLSDPVVLKGTQQTHQQYMLSRYFGDEVLSICTEFSYHMIATQSYCFLLHFVEEHNKDLLLYLKWPKFENLSDQVQLANHTLRQLNILDDSVSRNKYRSVLSFLNRCYTAMGKRSFQALLTHPTFNTTTLEESYAQTEALLQSAWFQTQDFSPFLSIRDIDKLGKQVITKKITFAGMSTLYTSISHAKQLFISYDTSHRALPNVNLFLDFMDTWFAKESIRVGVCSELDKELEREADILEKIDSIKHILEMGGKEIVCQDKKDTIRFHLTKTKGDLLKRNLKGVVSHGKVEFKSEDIRFVPVTKSHVEISFPLLDNLCDELSRCRTFIAERGQVLFQERVAILGSKWMGVLDAISTCIAELDVLVCKAVLAKTYRYCRPQIQDAETSFVDVQGLRHVLIEHIQQQELYVTNDLLMNGGVLLFGTNAVGKTSLMRSLGIATIMAQCGMYVPCQSFRFCPYRSIFSRIVGNDNLFKGMSTFAVEMSELRVILKDANEFSLILGDELCSGTETESALSIFVTSLQWLTKRKSSFLFATHFHEITEKQEVKELAVRFLHLEVHYDVAQDCLVYDRKLKAGSGPRSYGLEVCKSFYMDPLFLEQAYNLRRLYFPENTGTLMFPKSRYNAKKVRGDCEVCGLQGQEIHHLEHQEKADQDGFLHNQYHKNHLANLLTVCSKCHDEFHSLSPLSVSSSEVSKKKNTNGKYLLYQNL